MTAHTRILKTAGWYRSSYSGDTGNNCVEVAELTMTANCGVALRDSKNPDGPVLLLPPQPFAAFVEGVRGGRFGA
jgi:hypothetical protein